MVSVVMEASVVNSSCGGMVSGEVVDVVDGEVSDAIKVVPVVDDGAAFFVVKLEVVLISVVAKCIVVSVSAAVVSDITDDVVASSSESVDLVVS